MGMSNYDKKLREKVGDELIFMQVYQGLFETRFGRNIITNKGNGEK
jgi:hypothetical protein